MNFEDKNLRKVQKKVRFGKESFKKFVEMRGKIKRKNEPKKIK